MSGKSSTGYSTEFIKHGRSNFFMQRWWIYQRERFPLAAHGPLIAAFSFSAVSYSALLRDQTPRFASALVAFLTSLIFFALLRIADEWKDFEDDSRYRPYRPVPRGLVTLKELAGIGVAGAVIQLSVAFWFQPRLLLPLVVVWCYLALMSREFFVPTWLKARPFTYLWTHMLIMPLIDFYATACDWMRTLREPPHELSWFLLISFFNGVVIETGRKIRAPQDEEEGVETYSKVWGLPVAVGAWLTALLLTAAFAVIAAYHINFLVPVLSLLGALLTAAVLIARRFLRQPVSANAKKIELLSGIWTLMMYLMIGALPLLLRALKV